MAEHVAFNHVVMGSIPTEDVSNDSCLHFEVNHEVLEFGQTFWKTNVGAMKVVFGVLFLTVEQIETF